MFEFLKKHCRTRDTLIKKITKIIALILCSLKIKFLNILNCFDALILKIILKNKKIYIILMYFQEKIYFKKQYLLHFQTLTLIM